MNCDCVSKFDEQLKPRNCKVAMTITMTNDLTRMLAWPIVATERIGNASRRPLPTLIASYCPFCGVKLNEQQPADLGARGESPQ